MQKDSTINYWVELTKFAWLGQYISGIMGGTDKVFDEMTKNPPDTEKGLPSTNPEEQIIESWKEKAEKAGLKYHS